MGRVGVSASWTAAVEKTHSIESKYKRLVKAIAQDIEAGVLSPGTRLATQREVAAELSISVQTVTNAYKELERQGRIRCEVGRGSFVAPRVSEAMSSYMLDATERELVDFSTARIVHTASHDAAWRAVCSDLATLEDQPWIRSFRPVAGFDWHREAGVEWLASLNMPASPNSILVTNGAAHAVFLALASIVGPGDVVLTENLTDHGVIGLASVLGFTLKALDTDEHGIRPEHFEEMCDGERVSALVCTPTFNNPTVALMPDSRRRAIAKIAERYGVYIVEDDVYGPLPAQRRKPISSLIPELSFYCTSMTKSVLTGLRTGYLVMPRRHALRVESVLRVSSWMATSPIAEIATRWINDGTAARLVEMQRQHLSTRQTMVRATLGEHVVGSHPSALSAWLRLPEYWQPTRMVRELRNRQIAVTSPDPFLVGNTPSPNCVRICIGAEVPDGAFQSALDTIKSVFDQYPKVHDFE
ncbi:MULTISPECIES: PLP-dependent aminotransferase family protein [Burkholderiaceae]|uniref:MocR-like ectoine utilization transcription factor EhuR n=1 Tax=Burkholderiaceae TaxID=119060 RepID=UPI0007581BA6|nr:MULTISPECIES: PLP-dependent aminotransferase family protein [Burkholderiaceae]KVS06827.1 GntR family transcriptional regulator [Burkholderia vietnamiensis]MBR8087560.1 PLP-dependent aminotransferase family protein [Burkholderia vietnamiensis]